MYVIEHALLNLGKNKGRNILLGVIILAIITATVVALSIFNATGVVIEDTRAAMMSAVRIQPTQRTVGSQAELALDLELYEYFAQSAYITGANINETHRGIEATYYLIQPDILSAFEADLRNRGLPETYVIRTDESAFASVVAPVESLQNLSLTFLIIVMVLGGVIMVLLSAISIRERKYEIGVLRAMGMKKKKIVLSLWTEIIAITCICFVLGLGVGTMLSQPISDTILTGQTQTEASGSTTLADRIAGESGATREQSPAVNVSVDMTTALQIFGISILLASIAGLGAVSRITKYEPIKILMERT